MTLEDIAQVLFFILLCQKEQSIHDNTCIWKYFKYLQDLILYKNKLVFGFLFDR